MTSTYQENLNCLEKLWAAPSKEQVTRARPTDENVEFIQGKKGNNSLKINNILLHSRYHPVREAEEQIGTFNSSSQDYLVIWGLGLGYHVEAALRLFIGTSILVVEPNYEVIKQFLSNREDFTDWQHSRLGLVTSGEELETVLGRTKSQWISLFASIP